MKPEYSTKTVRAEIKSVKTRKGIADAVEATGEVVAMVSPFGGPPDLQGDVIDEHAYDDDIAYWNSSKNRLSVLIAHDWDEPTANIGYVKHLEAVKGYGLVAHMRLDLSNDRARYVHKLLSERRLTEFSIGYDVLPGGEKTNNDGSRTLTRIHLIEISIVLKGAAATRGERDARTELLTVKKHTRPARSKAEVATSIRDIVTDQMRRSSWFSPTLLEELAAEVKRCVMDPAYDAEDLQARILDWVSNRRALVQDAAVMADWELKGRLDDLTAGLFVGSKPWRVEQRDGRYCVVKLTDNSVEKCYDTREEAENYARALYAAEGDGKARKNADVWARLGELEGTVRTKSVGGTPLADEFIRADRAALAEEKRRDAELREVIVRAGGVPPTERQRDEYIQRQIQREMDEHERRDREREIEVQQRERLRDGLLEDLAWLSGRDAYTETVGATPVPETPRVHVEPRVHAAPPADEGVTFRAPVSQVYQDVRSFRPEPTPLAQAEPEAEVTVRLQVGGEVVPEVPVAQPAEDKFSIPAVPQQIGRTVEVQKPIPSPTTEYEPTEVDGLTVKPKPRRPRKEKK